MFLQLEGLLTAEEIDRLRRIAAAATFVDGRITNPDNSAKDNLHLRDEDARAVSSQILRNALLRNEEFQNFALPKTIAPPLITKYGAGKRYGIHYDAPFMTVEGRQLRSDLSCTIFLAAPDSYAGGELSVQLGQGALTFKGRLGSAIVYPSTTLHEVKPVASGERLVAITFIESRVADIQKREVLYEVGEVAALEGLNMSKESEIRLQRAHANLVRMWSDPS